MAVSIQSNDWLVFIDGVQVPYQGFTITTGMDAPAQGTLILDPDVLLTRLRPRAVIAIFCKDRYGNQSGTQSDTDKLLDGYFYYGGGEMVGYQDVKDPESRQFSIMFESDLGILATHQAFAFGVGGNHYFGQVVGTNLINPLDLADSRGPAGLLEVATIGAAFSKESGTSNRSQTRSTGGGSDSSEDFALRLVRVLSWLATSNASLRMQTVRTRLLNKMVGLQDQVLDRLVVASFAQKMMSEVQSQISSTDTVFQILMTLMGQVGYHLTTVPLPKDAGVPKGGYELVPVPDAMQPSVRERSQLRRSWYRNDYVFLPHLYYSAPPPCNLIFPDMMGGRTTSRNFMQEPTRSIIEDPFFDLGARLVFVHTDGLGEDLDAQTPDVFWGNYAKALSLGREGDEPSSNSAYVSAILAGGSAQNLLRSVSDDELERGLILRMQMPDAEYALAFARSLELKTKKSGSIQHKVETLEEIRAALGNKDSANDTSTYLRYVQSWLKYRHQLQRYNRPSNLTLRGHRWLVPGFSAVILDDVISYQGFVTAVTHTVDAEGQENTQVAMDFVRPVPKYDPEILDRVEKIQSIYNKKVQDSQTEVEIYYNSDSAKYERILAEYQQELNKGETLAVLNNDGVITGGYAVQTGRGRKLRQQIITRAQQYADATLGVGKTLSGSATAQRNPDLAQNLTPYLGADAILASPASTNVFIPTAYAEAQEAVDVIKQFHASQIAQAADGLPVYNPEPANYVGANVAVANRNKALSDRDESLKKIEEELDFPIPPDFYNQDFIKLETLDQMYQDVLGCPAFYTGEYGQGVNIEDSTEDEPAYLAHVRMLAVLNRVYRSLRAQVEIEDDDVAKFRSWEDVRESGDASDTLEWQHRTFLKRKAQTLRNYLPTHGFEPELSPYISDEPDPTVFYRMVPKSSDAPAVKGYNWDDSVISAVVDDKALAPVPITSVSPDSDFVQGVLKSADTTWYAIYNPAVDSEISFTSASLAASFADLPIEAFSNLYWDLSTGDNRYYVLVLGEPTAVPGDPVVEGEALVETTTYKFGNKSKTPIPDSSVKTDYDSEPDELVAERRKEASPKLTGAYRQEVVTSYSRRHFGSRGLAGL